MTAREEALEAVAEAARRRLAYETKVHGAVNTKDPLWYALAHLDALPADSEGWRPISEYPRDHEPSADTYWGPNVLLFVPSGIVAPSSDYRILTGRLEANMWLGWNDRDNMFDIEGTPSHFKPLPQPPATSSGGPAREETR